MLIHVLAIVLAVATFVAPATLQINTPNNLVQCQPTLLTWDGPDNSTFYVSIYPGGSTANALYMFNSTMNKTTTWTVNYPAGSTIGFGVKDNTGATALSGILKVQPSGDSSCLNSTVIVGTGGTTTTNTSPLLVTSTTLAGGIKSDSTTGPASTSRSSSQPSSTASSAHKVIANSAVVGVFFAAAIFALAP